MKCYKCDGKGHIEGFSHVSQGRCFLCNGSGELPDAKKCNVGYSRQFIRVYMQEGFFPENHSFALIAPISFIGHETAEEQLLEDTDSYYIGQPVCRASGWYKIPKSQMSEFCKHYKKALKRSIDLMIFLNNSPVS